MSKFSEESLFLIRNWDAYQDILKAGERLKPELSKLLSGIEGRLRKQEWWNAKWVLWRQDVSQIAFSDSRWAMKDGHLIWVGVEGFTPDAVFGSSPPPNMYVWINGKRPGLKAELQLTIRDSGKPVLGEMDTGQNSLYVVQKSLSKCLPEEIDMLEDMTFAPLVEFCGFYAQFFEKFNKAAQKHLSGSD